MLFLGFNNFRPENQLLLDIVMLFEEQLFVCTHRYYSLIAPDIMAALFVERTIAKKSFGNLTLLSSSTSIILSGCYLRLYMLPVRWG